MAASQFVARAMAWQAKVRLHFPGSQATLLVSSMMVVDQVRL